MGLLLRDGEALEELAARDALLDLTQGSGQLRKGSRMLPLALRPANLLMTTSVLI